MRIAVVLLALASLAAAPFYDARLEPPAGRVISGCEDGAGLPAYEKIVAPHPPAMISFEVAPDFSLVSDFLNHYREFAAKHGFFVAMVGLNFRGAEHDVSIGMRDPDLMVLADGLRDVGRPVLLRVGYAFNNPAALYQPSDYIGAFRHVADVFRREDPNSAMVWDATADGFGDPHYMKWYPGDDVVDWWGIDFVDAKGIGSKESETFVEEATHHRKPVVVSAISRGVKSEAAALKWYASVFDFVRTHPAIKALSLTANGFSRSPKVAAYLKQQLADARFIDATEAPALFRRTQ